MHAGIGEAVERQVCNLHGAVGVVESFDQRLRGLGVEAGGGRLCRGAAFRRGALLRHDHHLELKTPSTPSHGMRKGRAFFFRCACARA
jgi:hypothetical protein